MSFRVNFKTGIDTQNNAYTGLAGEITVNVSNNTLRIHDGATAGGTETARSDLKNINNVVFYNKAVASGLVLGGGTTPAESGTIVTTLSTGHFTLDNDHRGNTLLCSDTLDTFVTIPESVSLNIPVGSIYYLVNLSGYSYFVQPENSNVKLYLAAGDGTSQIRQILSWGSAKLVKLATDTWMISGQSVI